jgi:hypothetical protein
MKKQVKKLALAKETLRNLEGPEVKHAAGATGGCTVGWTEISCTQSPGFCYPQPSGTSC